MAAELDAEEIWALVVETAALPQAESGAFLRRKGVHEVQLIEWQATMLAALQRLSWREHRAWFNQGLNFRAKSNLISPDLGKHERRTRALVLCIVSATTIAELATMIGLSARHDLDLTNRRVRICQAH